MENIKQINIKICTYYLFNDMINIKNFDSSLVKIDKKSYKNIGIYYIEYIIMKSISDYEDINSVNPLHLIISKADGSIEENNGNRYLIFASTDKNKEVLEKCTKPWDEIKYLIKKINWGESGEYEKDFRRTKFNSDYDLPLNQILKLQNLTIIVSSVFEEHGKYYPQVFLDECLYEL